MIETLKEAFQNLKTIAQVASQLPAIIKEIQSLREAVEQYRGVLDNAVATLTGVSKQVNDLKSQLGRRGIFK